MYRKLFLVRLACLLSLFCITDSVYTVDSQTLVHLSPVEVQSPDVGEQLVLSVNIAGGENVAGYVFTLDFDSTALQLVSCRDAGYLPGAPFAEQPKVMNGNQVEFFAVSLNRVGRGAGTLAVVIFEVIAVKTSVLRLSKVHLSGPDATSLPVRVSTVETSVNPPIQEPVQPPIAETPVQEPFQSMQAEVSIPDANLAAAIREAPELPPGAAITADAMLNLTWLYAAGRGIADLTGLEYAVNLTGLDLGGGWVDNEWHHNPISNLLPLASLTNLESLDLGGTAVSDVSALASLTNLEWLDLSSTNVSDVSALASLTNLEELDLRSCPLNAAAHQTHIPAIQANGTQVEFDPFKPIHLPRVPSLVSFIYYRPSDRPVRPNVDAEIDALIKKVQRFFADEMERHGFGRKTFQFETDAQGNAVVHHVYGKFTQAEAHYRTGGKWGGEVNEQIYSPRQSIAVYMLDGDLTLYGGGGSGSPYRGGSAHIDKSWRWGTIAHELGHVFGSPHDHRAQSLMSYNGFDGSLSPCFAAWLDVHPAFNPAVVRSGTRAAVEMLPATLAAPPNAIRLRWTVTAPAGSLYQARLLTLPEKWTRDGYAFNSGGLIGCKRIDGNPTSSTVEFVTALTPDTESVSLQIIGIDGDIVGGEWFPIDVASLLPPAKVVSIPDPNLVAAVRARLNMSAGEPVTTHSILNLVGLEALNRGIKSLTGLEHAVNLTYVVLDGEYISGEGYVNSNAISNFSPLEKLTNLERLSLQRMSGLQDVSALASLTQLEVLILSETDVSDVSALASLTQLEVLILSETDVSDVSSLANLTQLKTLYLGGTGVSDVSSLANLTNLEELSLGGTDVSDVSVLANLTNLEGLYLFDTGVSDVSSLARLTQLKTLYLGGTGVSDVSSLAGLTNLEWLRLNYTAVSDVSPLLGLSLPGNWTGTGLSLNGCPLSYASIHTHIPALQAKGIGVEFDDVAHPALLKVSGDGQEDAGVTALPNPFVVEAMDEHGEPMVGQTVQFDILGGGGRLSARTVETDARGKAQVTLTLGSSQGVNKVKASSEGIRSWVLFMAVATEAAPQLVADVNGDGVTDLADLAIVAQAMGKPVENPRADVNGDGVVDGEDFALVAARLGEGEAAAPSQAALPAGLTLEKVEWALNLLHAENTGSPAFQRGIAKLEGFLALLVPDKTLLLANYPNPFNPETWIPYQLSEPAEVTVTIYAANGAVVRMLDLGHRRAGSYESRGRAAYWDGRNAAAEPVASGVYFYMLSAGDFSATRKMVIRK